MGNFGANRSSPLIVGSQGHVLKAKVTSANLSTLNSVLISWKQSSMFVCFCQHVVGMMMRHKIK